MSLVINGDFEIMCVQCDEKYSFTPDEVDFQEIDREETVIGLEILYEWTYKMGCDCTNSIVIDYSIWECPENTLSETEIIPHGFKVLKEFDISFEESYTRDDLSDAE